MYVDLASVLNRPDTTKQQTNKSELNLVLSHS